LQDAAKRDELIETLRAIVKVPPPLSTQPTATSVEPPTAADGFGADALLQASTKIGEFSSEIEQSMRAATKLPLFWRWLTNTATDPQAQQLLLSVLWRAVTVALLALLAERVAQFALRRPLAALEAHAPREAIQTAPVEALGADEAETLRLGRVKWLRTALPRAVRHGAIGS
jgi:hypothetical protein